MLSLLSDNVTMVLQQLFLVAPPELKPPPTKNEKSHLFMGPSSVRSARDDVIHKKAVDIRNYQTFTSTQKTRTSFK